MSENRESCDMRRVEVEDVDDWLWNRDQRAKPGDFMIRESVVSRANPVCLPTEGEPTVTIRYFIACLPGGHVCSLPIRPVPQTEKPVNGGHSWEWDGNLEKPTLTPSVNSIGEWHGWIRAGRMVSC